MSPAPSSEAPPEDLFMGIGGVEFIPAARIERGQIGYAGAGWNADWLVVAREMACGDPIFVDRARPELPVLTAMHGMGTWKAIQIAPSWQAFLNAIEMIRPFTKGRDRRVDVASLPAEERESMLRSLQTTLGSPLSNFWTQLFDG